MVLYLVCLRVGHWPLCLRGYPVCDESRLVVAEYDVLEADMRKRGRQRIEELELELHVIRRGEFTAENVEVEFFAVVAAPQCDEEALKPLLTVQDKALLLVVVRHFEVTEVVPVFFLEVVNELAATDSHLGLPDQQRANGVLPENGIE